MRRWPLMLLALGLAALAGAAAKDDRATVAELFVIKKDDGRVAARLSATDGGAIVELFDLGADAEQPAPASRNRANERPGDRPATKPGSRASLALSPDGLSSLALRDAAGRTRFQVATNDDGATTLAIFDGRGNTVWGVSTDAAGRLRLQSQPTVTPTGAHDRRQ